jgi:phospholipid/cholesterol/gamma-HCH transport system substrate-binding protein
MEKNAHFAIVGAFLILSLILGVVFLLWLTEAKQATKTSRYEIRFEGSVSGLDLGGDVSYLGVKIGNIYQISLMPNEPRMVRVIVNIKDDSPIYENTVATLKLQGVTGIAYVELTQGEGGQKRIAGSEEPPYPVIRSRKSDLDKLLTSMPEVLQSVDEFLKRASGVLNDENIENTTLMLANLKQFSDELQTLDEELFKTLSDMRETLGETRRLVRNITPDTEKTLKNLEQTTANLEQLSASINTLVQNNEGAINTFMSEGVGELMNVLDDTQKTLLRLRRLSQQLSDDPSRLLYQPKHYGVEIQQ